MTNHLKTDTSTRMRRLHPIAESFHVFFHRRRVHAKHLSYFLPTSLTRGYAGPPDTISLAPHEDIERVGEFIVSGIGHRVEMGGQRLGICRGYSNPSCTFP